MVIWWWVCVHKPMLFDNLIFGSFDLDLSRLVCVSIARWHQPKPCISAENFKRHVLAYIGHTFPCGTCDMVLSIFSHASHEVIYVQLLRVSAATIFHQSSLGGIGSVEADIHGSNRLTCRMGTLNSREVKNGFSIPSTCLQWSTLLTSPRINVVAGWMIHRSGFQSQVMIACGGVGEVPSLAVIAWPNSKVNNLLQLTNQMGRHFT